MKIHILDNATVLKIKAFEFIDSPSFILKELLENSCDAKSKNIFVYIYNYGFDCIKVIDYGLGICKNDLFLSISSFSTSKIISYEDISCVKTYGFRGESLHLISSVCNLEIISKVENSVNGYRLYLNKKNNYVVENFACNFGTIVSLNDIFGKNKIYRDFCFDFNVEMLKIIDVFNIIVLSNLNVNFFLYHNDKLLKKFYFANKSEGSFEKLKLFLGDDYLKGCFYIDTVDKKKKIYGWVCINNFFSTFNSYVFLNNRFVKNNILDSSISSFYNFLVNINYLSHFCLFI